MTTPVQPRDIVFTRYGSQRGVAWLGEAWRMFRGAPLNWLVVIAVYVFIIGIASVTAVTQLAVLIARPVLAVGLLAAAWSQERGGAPSLGDLFLGFRANVRALLLLGAVFVAWVTGAVFATALVDGGLLVDVLSGRVAADSGGAAKVEELVRSGRLLRSMLLAIALVIPVVLALWFAPALVVFQDASARTAFGASLRAAIANWRPLAAYALVVLGVGLMLPLAAATLVALAFPEGVARPLLLVGLIAFGLVFQATLHISDYVSYRDVFHAGETLAPAGRTGSKPG
jgi:hypothetical protein